MLQVYQDLYLDMEDTDEFIYQILNMAHQRKRRLGILFVESFRTCAWATKDCNIHCPAHRQGFLVTNSTLTGGSAWQMLSMVGNGRSGDRTHLYIYLVVTNTSSC
jgi:hypothetical protein